MQANPETLAWRILLGAFSVFLLLCGSTIYAAQWFIFQSTVDMPVEMTVARGTAQITLPNTGEPIAVADRRDDLVPGATVRTDPNTQAVLTFLDQRTERPIASIVVFRDTQLTLTTARAPRFGLNKAPYQVQAQVSTGRVEVLVLDAGSRRAHIEVLTPHTFSRMEEQGEYLVDVSTRLTRVTTRTGGALVVEHTSGRHVNLDRDEQVTVHAENSVLEPVQAARTVVANGTFEESFDVAWQFYNDREPPGEASSALFDGRPVLVLDRSQSRFPGTALGHGETGMVQPLDVDLRSFDALELRATFYIAEQSLSTCGIAGSECPMMVHIRYTDSQGQVQDFRHGFYATHDPGLGYPLACNTCRSDHDRINGSSWYTYESGNLLSLFPISQKPVHLSEISFYASGHAYKVYVSEMNLLVWSE